MRSLFLFLIPAVVWPALLPETIGHWKRGEPAVAAAPDPKVWAEYGLRDAETSPYSDAGQTFFITAWRFDDATGAMAAFDDLVPADARKAALMGLSAETATDAFVAAGNYLLHFKGYKIHGDELSHVVATIAKYGYSPLPTLPNYLPLGARPYSERYITGPASLARFAPGIPPSTAAFHFNAEAVVAKYGATGKETTLVIFSYPSMEMARDRLPHFQQVPGAVVKRSGPIVALAMNAPGADDAERLLSKVKYAATVTLPEHVQNQSDNTGTLFLNIFILCLILVAMCVVAGIVVGGLRIMLRRSGPSGDGEPMISLHISDRR
ncbi:MAG: DUF6599 family protein [Terriglobia bacterium]